MNHAATVILFGCAIVIGAADETKLMQLADTANGLTVDNVDKNYPFSIYVEGEKDGDCRGVTLQLTHEQAGPKPVRRGASK